MSLKGYAFSVLQVLVVSCSVSADTLLVGNQELNSPRGRLSNEATVSPLTIKGGSTLTLISPEEWKPLGQKLGMALDQTHQQFSRILGTLPPLTTSLRLMDEETFFLSTGAPRWTNALYYRNQIIIPLQAGGAVDYENIARSLRHEYVHAIINGLSGGKCPGWLDEGLAQWAEGQENPALRPALAQYLEKHQAVPLSMLQGGFTKLDNNMVAAAYGQSLFATKNVIDTYGFKAIRHYLDALRMTQDKARSFEIAFGISEETYGKRLNASLKNWARTVYPQKF